MGQDVSVGGRGVWGCFRRDAPGQLVVRWYASVGAGGA